MTMFGSLIRHALLSFALQLAPRLANVAIFIALGRRTGAADAGVFVLATTYLLIATTLMRGLDDLVMRQVAREPDRAGSYLRSFSLLRLSLVVVLYVALATVTRFVFDYPPQTDRIILILGLALLPDNLAYAAQAVLMGRRRFGVPAAAWTATSVIRLAGGLMAGDDLIVVAWSWLIGATVGMSIMMVEAFRVSGDTPADWRDWTALRHNGRAALVFTMLTSLAMLESQSDTIILSVVHDTAEVGFFNAATTIAYSLALFSQAYRFAVYPIMSRDAVAAPPQLIKVYAASLRWLALLALPMVAGIIAIAPQLIPWLYGAEFEPTIRVLQILVVTLVFIFLNEPNFRLLLVRDQQGTLLRLMTISAGVNIGLNLLLAPGWGAVGSAVARVASAALLFALVTRAASRERSAIDAAGASVTPILYGRLSRIAAAAALMGGIVYYAATWPLFVRVLLGAIVYLSAVLVVGAVTQAEKAKIRTWLRRA